MADVPYCIIDYIMKFAGAYSQHPYKKDYLEDIKLIIHPHKGVKQALNTIYFKKNAYRIISWDILSQMMWGGNLGGAAGNFMVSFEGPVS